MPRQGNLVRAGNKHLLMRATGAAGSERRLNVRQTEATRAFVVSSSRLVLIESQVADTNDPGHCTLDSLRSLPRGRAQS